MQKVENHSTFSPGTDVTRRIVFVFGLSSTGKSTLGEFLRGKGWLYIEMDQYKPGIGGGIDVLGIRAEWKHFIAKKNPDKLIAEFRARAQRASAKDVVICFSSCSDLKKPHLARIKEKATLIYLAGKEEFCVREFESREKRTGRNLPTSHWHKHNRDLAEQLKDPAFQKYIINVFNEDGSRKTLDELLGEVERRVIR